MLETKNNNVFKIISQKKKLLLSIFCLCLGVIFLLSNSHGIKKQKNDEKASDLAEYTKNVENKILELCSKVDGVSKVSVAVSFENGFEYVYAQNDEKGTYLIIGNGSNEKAVKITEIPPKISGIGIVCKGGGDIRIQKKLLNLISAAYDVNSNKIYIAEAKNN